MPEASFALLVKRQISSLEAPCLRCVELVNNELQHIIQYCGTEKMQEEMTRFPKLQQKIIAVTNNILRNYLTPCKGMVKKLIEFELAYIDTNHPDFQEAHLVRKLFTQVDVLQYNANIATGSNSKIDDSGESENEVENILPSTLKSVSFVFFPLYKFFHFFTTSNHRS